MKLQVAAAKGLAVDPDAHRLDKGAGGILGIGLAKDRAHRVLSRSALKGSKASPKDQLTNIDQDAHHENQYIGIPSIGWHRVRENISSVLPFSIKIHFWSLSHPRVWGGP